MRTSLSFCRVATLVALVCLLAFPLAAADVEHNSAPATYLGGSVVSIPGFTAGVLDASENSQMSFVYGENSFSLAYTPISSMELSSAQETPTWKKVATLGVLFHPAFHKDGPHELTLYYKNVEGIDCNVTFELNTEPARQIVSLLERYTGKRVARDDLSREREKQIKNAFRPAENPHILADGSWWGDRIWKTQRSEKVWKSDAPAGAETVEAAAGKE